MHNNLLALNHRQNTEQPLQEEGTDDGGESQNTAVMDQLVSLLSADFHLNASVDTCGNSRCWKWKITLSCPCKLLIVVFFIKISKRTHLLVLMLRPE